MYMYIHVYTTCIVHVQSVHVHTVLYMYIRRCMYNTRLHVDVHVLVVGTALKPEH